MMALNVFLADLGLLTVFEAILKTVGPPMISKLLRIPEIHGSRSNSPTMHLMRAKYSDEIPAAERIRADIPFARRTYYSKITFFAFFRTPIFHFSEMKEAQLRNQNIECPKTTSVILLTRSIATCS